MRVCGKDLEGLIPGGESSTLEFKRSLPSKVREIAQEICAFANTNGGRVVIGVDDANQVVGATIMVELYDDRVAITNPGGLLPQVARDFGHMSLSRNKLIFGLFTRMQLVEKVGSGIFRMEQEMKREGFDEPKFENTGFFKAIFLKKEGNETAVEITQKSGEKSGEKKVSTLEKNILTAVVANSKITTAELMAQLGCSKRQVEFRLEKLKRIGRLRRVGPDKGGHWEVVEKREN